MAPLVTPRQLNKAKAFLDEILAKVPEDQRESVRSLYSQAQDEVSGIAASLDTAIATVNTTAERQGAWYDKHKDVIEGRTPAAQPAVNPIANAVDADKIVKDLNLTIDTTREALASQGLFLASVIPTILTNHSIEFGEQIDGEKLVKDAIAANTDLKTYYAGLVAPKRAEKAAAKLAADIAAAEERGRLAGMKEAGGSNPPYPTSQRGPTTLSGLRKPPADQAPTYGLEAAVNTVMTEMAKNQ